MAERSNAAVLKTVVLLSWDRGFESLFLRQSHSKPFAFSGEGFLFSEGPFKARFDKDPMKTKIPRITRFAVALKPPPGITDEQSEEVIPLLLPLSHFFTHHPSNWGLNS
jgi:hypothetical protein